MSTLEHPLLPEIESIRNIIRKSDSRLQERIKWSAPSYYYIEDIVTFNPRATEHVHLVFHHPFIESIDSPLLEGNYKGRRMMYFKTLKEVKEKAPEVRRILQILLEHIAGKSPQ